MEYCQTRNLRARARALTHRPIITIYVYAYVWKTALSRSRQAEIERDRMRVRALALAARLRECGMVEDEAMTNGEGGESADAVAASLRAIDDDQDEWTPPDVSVACDANQEEQAHEAVQAAMVDELHGMEEALALKEQLLQQAGLVYSVRACARASKTDGRTDSRQTDGCLQSGIVEGNDGRGWVARDGGWGSTIDNTKNRRAPLSIARFTSPVAARAS